MPFPIRLLHALWTGADNADVSSAVLLQFLQFRQEKNHLLLRYESHPPMQKLRK